MSPLCSQVAKWLGAPVLLVVDCWALARSVGAVVLGYRDFDKPLRLGAVIFNKVGGEAHTKWLADALQSAGLGVRVLGGIPKVRGAAACQGPRGQGGKWDAGGIQVAGVLEGLGASHGAYRSLCATQVSGTHAWAGVHRAPPQLRGLRVQRSAFHLYPIPFSSLVGSRAELYPSRAWWGSGAGALAGGM